MEKNSIKYIKIIKKNNKLFLKKVFNNNKVIEKEIKNKYLDLLYFTLLSIEFDI